MKNGKYLTYPKIDREQTWNFPSVLSIFNFKCKIINQNVVINGSDVIDTSDKIWIVQNGKYLTYPKIDHEQTWNFSLILSIFNFKCKIINQNVVINGSDIIDTSDKIWIVQNGKYLTYPKIDREQTWNFSLIWSIFDFECKILDQNATINGRDIINTRVKV